MRAAPLLLLWHVAGCEPRRVEEVAAAVPSPGEQDVGELCADVAGVRACWGAPPGEVAACEGGACVVTRPLPAYPSASGWRCDGMRGERTCTPSVRQAAPFECAGDQCLQRFPRQPDQGEWECAELDGVVRCAGGHAAAGVPPGPNDAGWLCGARRGGAAGERVCVDLAPDVPASGSASSWRCRFHRKGGITRTCARAAATVRLGDVCGPSGGCPAGAACIRGRCIPPRPEPACYLDDDCGAGKACRFGSCADAR